ncbi:GNAT family N-acetyltransferase [Alkalimonas collagenimarina]|uniref:GNAT family N-acetyltransferase n=1 Tax=Alkalimonas collagenimarina TaxID=400390 RepID=A0ABT9GUL0_9GAMM|nr:GNAT family N-acetyltransferase [Alkalimonas collagenimarina]MDP4534738.1 GNAT family N-acetyltransferase [Alkalimonas collagenimarina]
MNLDGLIVREARSDDYEPLLALEQKVVDAERPYNALLKETGAYYYDINKLISAQDTKLFVGEISGALIATGYVQIRQSKASLQHAKHGYLGFMYVAEAYRGLGLNQVILQKLVSWGQAQGINHFYLDVYAKNSSAIRAYEKFGFQSSLLEMTLNTEAD